VIVPALWSLLSRRGGRRLAQQGGLAVLATAVCTTLLLLTVGGWQGFEARADRVLWRAADGVGGSLDAVDGRPVTVLDVRAGTVVPGGPPVEAGEVRTSPAAQALLDRVPAATERFVSSDRVAGARDGGRLAAAALLHPDEAAVLVGRDADDPRFAVTRVQAGDELAEMYVFLAMVGVVLVTVPLLSLGGAAARLGVARRNERLAALRLVGATGRQVLGLAALEALAAAAVGVLVGIVGYLALLVPVGLVPFQGAPLGADLWLGAGGVAAVTGVVLLLTAVSALVGLRSVVVTPLGVVHRHTPRGLRAVRALVMGAVLLGWAVVSGGATLTGILVFLGLVFGVLTLVGPWVLGVWGRIRCRTARTVPQMLAARRLVDDPRGTWRIVGGLALAAFVAGAVSVSAALDVRDDDGPRAVTALVPDQPGLGDAVAAARADLAALGVATGAPGPGDFGPGGAAGGAVLVVEPPAGVDEDAVRAALTAALPGVVLDTPQDAALAEQTLVGDIRTGGYVVLVCAVLVAATGAGIAAAASVLDRRRAYALLALAGTPARVLDASRRAELRGPLLLTAVGSLAASWAFLFPLTGMALLTDPASLAVVAVAVAAGVALVMLASEASRPLLRAVVRTASVRPD
jgi:hypothetical protein